MSSENNALTRRRTAVRRKLRALNPTQLAHWLVENLPFKPVPTYHRPTDVLLLLLGVLWLLLASVLFLSTAGYFRVAQLLFAVANVVPRPLAELWQRLLELGTFSAILCAVLLAALWRRWLLIRNLAVGGVLTWVLTGALDAMLAPVTHSRLPAGDVAILATLAAVADGFLDGVWRSLAWLLLAAAALAGFLIGAFLPIEILGGLALGLVLGALTNLLLGVPRPDLSAQVIKKAFGAHERVLKNIYPVRADARGSVPYLAKAADGAEYFVKLVGPEQRTADFLFKLWRTLLLRDPASTAPFLTPMQQIEHEAYLTLLAQKHGVRTPDVEFTARVSGDFALEAQRRVAGRELLDVDEKLITGALLSEIWQQAAKLREARIYHGDLRLSNILIDARNQPWIVDFGFAASDADDNALAQDVAQLLASMSYVVGAERAVISARNVLGSDALIAALLHLSPLALSSATRVHLRQDPELLNRIHEEIEQEAGSLPADAQASVFRLRPQQLFWLIGLGIGIYVLFPQLGQWPQILGAWRNANPAWLLLGLLVSASAYALAPFTIRSLLNRPIRWSQFFMAQFAASFASRFGPQGIGGAYVLEKFVEKAHVPRRRAVAAVTVSLAAGVLVHSALTLVALALLGIHELPFLQHIHLWQIGLALGIGILLVILIWRWPERVTRAWDSLQVAMRELWRALKKPRRSFELLGSSLGVTAAYIITLYLSLLAVGANVSPVTVAAVFLVGAVIGQASPTPGGLGVVEGAFVAGLTALGVSTNLAVAGVLLYRLLTFWLPIIPGAFAFRYLQEQDRI